MESLGTCIASLAKGGARRAPLARKGRQAGECCGQFLVLGETMKSGRTLETLVIVFVRWLAERLPVEERTWGEAMLGELAVIDGAWKRLVWLLSACVGLARIYTRARSAPVWNSSRPTAVTLISVYHAGFSCVLLALLAGQIPAVKPPRSEAVLPLIFAFSMALVPAGIALGLWVLDDLARGMAILFSVLHALGTAAWLTMQAPGLHWFALARIALDFLMAATLLAPRVSRSFQYAPAPLHLRN